MPIIDTTLREGEQMPGVSFTPGVREELLGLLAGVGVEEIELGVVAGGYESLRKCRETMDMARYTTGGRCRLSFWTRCMTEDIGAAASLKPDAVSISVPVSDIHLRNRLQRDRAWALDRIRSAVDTGKKARIPYVSIGMEDSTRADEGFLLQACRVAAAAGADRVRISDTTGVATPSRMARLVRMIDEHAGISVAVHAHNDFGMATATAVECLAAGAGWADASVLGLGERAGITRLEELVGHLSLTSRDSVESGRYKPSLLPALCRMIGRAARVSVNRNHPVVGAGIFECESGIHVHGIARDPNTYEPYPPELTGGQRRILLGAKSGRGAVAAKLLELGLKPGSAQGVAGIAQAVRDLGQRLGRPVTDDEFIGLMEETGKRGGNHDEVHGVQGTEA